MIPRRGPAIGTQNGFALPLAVLLVTVLAIVGFGLIFGLSKSVNQGLAGAKIDNKYHGPSQAALQAAQFNLQRPDNPASAHVWTSGYTNQFSLDINGAKVHVKVEDIEEDP